MRLDNRMRLSVALDLALDLAGSVERQAYRRAHGDAGRVLSAPHTVAFDRGAAIQVGDAAEELLTVSSAGYQ